MLKLCDATKLSKPFYLLMALVGFAMAFHVHHHHHHHHHHHYSCPTSYSLDAPSGMCYSQLSKRAMNYRQAKEWCRNKKGRLPILLTQEDLKYFKDRVPEMYPMPRHGGTGYWLGGVRKGNGFVWEDTGETVRLTNFRPGQPDNYRGVENRLHVPIHNIKFRHKWKGTWNDINENESNHVICQTKWRIKHAG